MKITVEFDTWEEMEVFRTSGKRTRGKGQKDDDVEVALTPATEQMAQSIRDAQPIAAQPAPAPVQGFPGANGQAAPPSQVHPLVNAMLARIDGAIASGQPADAIITWFRQQIGPDAAQATLDQIKQVFIPRMTEAQLKAIAPQLGIQA